MRVIIVSIVYPPEPIVSAQTSGHLAEWLVENGHAVSVITNFPNRPGGRIYPGYQAKWNWIERDEKNFRLVRCYTTLSKHSSLISRFLENISFGFSSTWALLMEERPDVIYSNSWPIFATGLLMLVAQIRCVPVVVRVQDIYPESLTIQRRVNERNLIFQLMIFIDRWIANQSARVLVISKKFEEIYINRRNIPKSKVEYIPNWIDTNDFKPGQKTDIRAIHNIPADTFLSVYGGNIGVAAGVENLISTFSFVAKNISLLIAGDGSRLSACQKLASETAPGQIYFHHPWPTEETGAVYRSADLLIIPTQGQQSLVSVPSKLLAYMLSSRPILALALPGSDLAKIIEDSGCGWVIPPNDPKKIATKLVEISALSELERERFGAAGRTYVLNNLSKDVCLPVVGHILQISAEDK